MDSKYLRQRRRGWYARVRVPPSLKHVLGHAIEVSLKTQDPKVAERRKHAVVGDIKERIERARQAEAAERKTNPAEKLVAQVHILRDLVKRGETDAEVARLEDLDRMLETFIRENNLARDPQ